MPANPKKVAVRRLESALRLLLSADETSLSGLQNGRLAVELRKSVARLRRLERDDPDKEFWPALEQAMLKMLTYLLRRF
jgi:hypothetical protein